MHRQEGIILGRNTPYVEKHIPSFTLVLFASPWVLMTRMHQGWLEKTQADGREKIGENKGTTVSGIWEMNYSLAVNDSINYYNFFHSKKTSPRDVV
jgi:hypothetical protein